MIKAEFLRCNGECVAFSISGHAGAGRYGQDIVCAAVSSAVMLTCNTITDFLYTPCDVRSEANKVTLIIKEPEGAMSIAAKQVLGSFCKHLQILAEESSKIEIKFKDTVYQKGKKS